MTISLAHTSPLPREDLQSIVERAGNTWEHLRGQRIFVTGGTGFFGKWILESFAFANAQLDLRAEMVVLTRKPERIRSEMPSLSERSGIRFQQGDVRDFPFKREEFSHVIHAATDASAALNLRDPRTMFDVIVAGTSRVLDFAQQCGARRFLLVSSGAVYGPLPAGVTNVSETFCGGPDPISPSAAYAEGKRVAEMLCAEAHANRGLTLPIARCFAFVGPHLPLDRHFAIGNFLSDALCGGPIIVRSDGRDHRSYMYAADLTYWLWAILVAGDSCRAYNVGSDQRISIRDVADLIARVSSCKLRIEGSARAVGETPTYYVPSIERARSELGLNIEVDLESAINRTFNWHRARKLSKGIGAVTCA